jgi:hypothetical protein
MPNAAIFQEFDSLGEHYHIIRPHNHDDVDVLAGSEQLIDRIEHVGRRRVAVCVASVPIMDFRQAIMADADLHSGPKHDSPRRNVDVHSVRCGVRSEADAKRLATACGMVQELEQKVGFQERFAAEETEFERSPRSNRSQRPVDRGLTDL